MSTAELGISVSPSKENALVSIWTREGRR